MRNNRGQALVEYVLIIALVSILAITLIKALGGYLQDTIQKTICETSGLRYVPGEDAGTGTCEEIVEVE